VSDEDHWAYTGWLKEDSSRYRADIHVRVMMTNMSIFRARRRTTAV